MARGRSFKLGNGMRLEVIFTGKNWAVTAFDYKPTSAVLDSRNFRATAWSPVIQTKDFSRKKALAKMRLGIARYTNPKLHRSVVRLRGKRLFNPDHYSVGRSAPRN